MTTVGCLASDPSLARQPAVVTSLASDRSFTRQPTVVTSLASDRSFTRQPTVVTSLASDRSFTRQPTVVTSLASDWSLIRLVIKLCMYVCLVIFKALTFAIILSTSQFHVLSSFCYFSVTTWCLMSFQINFLPPVGDQP